MVGDTSLFYTQTNTTITNLGVNKIGVFRDTTGGADAHGILADTTGSPTLTPSNTYYVVDENSFSTAFGRGNHLSQMLKDHRGFGVSHHQFQFTVKGTMSLSEHEDNTQVVERVSFTDINFFRNFNDAHTGLGAGTGTLVHKVGFKLNKSLLKSTVNTEITSKTQFVITNVVPVHSGSLNGNFNKKVNVYSFALKPEEHQPSGTCNFSRIDSAQLVTESALEAGDKIYAVNYNVLRIMSGMGGLAYSN